MAYNNLTNRGAGSAGDLVPPEHRNTIIAQARQMSAALNYCRRIPILTNTKSFPVIGTMPSAHWLTTTGTESDDTALIQTTDMSWKNVEMKVADLATIAPIPRRFASDIAAAGINITNELVPYIAQAIAKAVDKAVLFGTEKPFGWPTGIYTAAHAAGNVTEIKTTGAKGGLRADLFKTLKQARLDGFQLDAAVARPGFEYDLMAETDNVGRPLFIPREFQTNDALAGRLLGRDVTFATDGVFPADEPGAAQLIFFDSTKHMIGIREEIYLTVHTDGIIQDNSGAVQYNLMQQDIIAVRAVFRVGYAVANPATLEQPTESSRYPAAVLTSVAA